MCGNAQRNTTHNATQQDIYSGAWETEPLPSALKPASSELLLSGDAPSAAAAVGSADESAAAASTAHLGAPGEGTPEGDSLDAILDAMSAAAAAGGRGPVRAGSASAAGGAAASAAGKAEKWAVMKARLSIPIPTDFVS